MNMGVYGTRQHLRLHVAAERHVILGRLGMGDAHGILLDDRSLIQIGGDIMRRRANQLHTALIGLLVGVGPLKDGRKEWWILMILPDIASHILSESTCM